MIASTAARRIHVFLATHPLLKICSLNFILYLLFTIFTGTIFIVFTAMIILFKESVPQSIIFHHSAPGCVVRLPACRVCASASASNASAPLPMKLGR